MNHVQSQHAGALFTAGEAASGGAFVGGFAERMAEITPLAEKAEIQYRKVARGDITARATLSADSASCSRSSTARAACASRCRSR